MNGIRFLISYIGIIFLFGLIYFFIWFFYPDSFVIDEQYNLHPFSSRSIMGEDAISLTYYQRKADSIRKNEGYLRTQIVIYKKIIDSLEPLKNDAYKRFEDKQWENADKWEKAQLDSLTKKLRIIESAIEYTSGLSHAEVALAQLKVEKSAMDYEIAKVKVNAIDFVLSNLTMFQDSTLTNKMMTLDSLYSLNKYQLLPKAELALLKNQFDIDQLKFEALSSFSKRISFLDFLLFSASNSSTVTYGDVIPNSNLVRIILFIQAISCIFLIALGTDKVLKKYMTESR